MSYFNGKINLTEKQVYDYVINEGILADSNTYDVHYLKYYEKYKKTGKIISWNWAAFFLTSVWLPYRKMYSLFILDLVIQLVLHTYVYYYNVVGFIEKNPSNIHIILHSLAFIIIRFFFGFLGDYLYLKHREKKAVSNKPMKEKRWKGIRVFVNIFLVIILSSFVVGIGPIVAIPNYVKFQQALNLHRDQKFNEALQKFEYLAYQKNFALAKAILESIYKKKNIPIDFV